MARQRELERAMRAHPAGRALGGRATGAGIDPRVHASSGECAVPAPRLRLTVRGRVLVTVLLLALAVGVGALVGAAFGGGAGSGLHLAGESRVVVHSGDTLWSIARTVAGDDDVRAVVHRIQQVNGLRSTALVPGQVLRLP